MNKYLIAVWLALASVALVPSTSHAQKRSSRYLPLTGMALTTTAPAAGTDKPSSATDLKLVDVTGWKMLVCADSGNLTGGTVTIYEYMERPVVWAEAKSFTYTITTTGPCQLFDDVEVMVGGAQWLRPKTTSVTVSAGTTVSIYFYATVETP